MATKTIFAKKQCLRKKSAALPAAALPFARGTSHSVLVASGAGNFALIASAAADVIEIALQVDCGVGIELRVSHYTASLSSVMTFDIFT